MRQTPVIDERVIKAIEFKHGGSWSISDYNITEIVYDADFVKAWTAYNGDKMVMTRFDEPTLITYK